MQGYNGVIPFYRSDFEKYKHLKPQEFVLRWAIICNMDWDDVHHPKRYGICDANQKYLAEYLGWKEPQLTYWLPKLLAKNPGFYKDEKGRFMCLDYDAYKYKEAFSREKIRREAQHINETNALNERKAQLSQLKDSISNHEDQHQDLTVTSPSKDSSLVSFSGKFIENEKIPDSLTLDEKIKKYVDKGYSRKDITEPCFCGSGLAFINCCLDVMDEILPLSDGKKEV